MKVIKKIDKFGHPIGLNFNKGDVHTTKCGSIVTILIYMLMCSLIVKKIIVLATYDGDNITMNQEGFDPSRHTEHRVN